MGELGDAEWGRGLGQVREPGLPTSHLVPRHSVHHVHLTEEKRVVVLGPGLPWPQRPQREVRIKVQRGLYPCPAPPHGGIIPQDSLLQGEPKPSQCSSCPAQPPEEQPGDPPPPSANSMGTRAHCHTP